MKRSGYENPVGEFLMLFFLVLWVIGFFVDLRL